MNQDELRKMAEERILDAKALLDASRWEFGYYVAGYAVECALKSCLLARMVHTAWVFQEKWEAKVCLTHDFAKLVELAGKAGCRIWYCLHGSKPSSQPVLLLVGDQACELHEPGRSGRTRGARALSGKNPRRCLGKEARRPIL